MATDVLNIDRLGLGICERSEVGYIASHEHMALSNFSKRLGSASVQQEVGIGDEKDVQREAKLLMSLSYTSPADYSDDSGRTSPESIASSCSGSTSRRDSFSFRCPSLSLDAPIKLAEFKESIAKKRKVKELSSGAFPSELLGRVLKVDDRDALRLSAEAMARNIMQSYRKAIQWRIQSWVESLSRVLVKRESELVKHGASEMKIRDLLLTGEAKLIKKLQEISEEIRVTDARTSFRVLPQRVPRSGQGQRDSKRLRFDQLDATVLEETEYNYEVAHALILDVLLNIYSPAGYVEISLQVPGTIDGTFLSSETGSEGLTDVKVELDTDILASMIEKSCRTVVKSSAQAALEDGPALSEHCIREVGSNSTHSARAPTTTPKKDVVPPSHEHVSGFAVVTPRDVVSPPTCDCDSREKPVLLPIPDDFEKKATTKGNLRMVSPQPNLPHDVRAITFTPRVPSKATTFPSMVSPTPGPKLVERTKAKGPYLPVLVEVACAAMQDN